MKRPLCKFPVFVLFLVAFISCNDEILPEVEDLEEKQEYYDIEIIRPPCDDETATLSEFISSAEQLDLTFMKYDHSYHNAEVVEYTGLEGKSIVVGYNDPAEKDGTESSLILLADQDNQRLTYYEHIRKDMGQTYKVRIYHEGREWLVSTVDKHSGEVLEISYLNSSKNEDEDEKISFNECAKIAIDSCVEDKSCAFTCAVLWKYCLGAIALACFLVTV